MGAIFFKMTFTSKITWIKCLVFFSSFSTITWIVLFELIFLLRLISLSSKSVFVIKFACANLAAKLSTVNLLNSGVVIYLSWLWLVTFFSILLIFCHNLYFLTKLLTSGILFSNEASAEFVAKPLIFYLGILLSISVILAL